MQQTSLSPTRRPDVSGVPTAPGCEFSVRYQKEFCVGDIVEILQVPQPAGLAAPGLPSEGRTGDGSESHALELLLPCVCRYGLSQEAAIVAWATASRKSRRFRRTRHGRQRLRRQADAARHRMPT